MKNYVLPPNKSGYIALGILLVIVVIAGQFETSMKIDPIGSLALGGLGMSCILLGVLLKESTLMKLSYFFIFVNVVGAVFSFFSGK